MGLKDRPRPSPSLPTDRGAAGLLEHSASKYQAALCHGRPCGTRRGRGAPRRPERGQPSAGLKGRGSVAVASSRRLGGSGGQCACSRDVYF
ncbi:hypothetical protein NDU88_007941 [Pleurodeles waltl]|uniref:Uncharacterized protein n=1 Tax=Pleurodeles waltl TaxID=8319 RepID=A0AAV7U2Q5_PLEWA|nr:hypothetical protein NDU88_007941 [Pleurodeles waltl]